MEPVYTFRFTFLTDEGKTSALTIPYAAPGVTDAEINEAMNKIIESEALYSKNGGFIAKEKAELIKTDSRSISVK